MSFLQILCYQLFLRTKKKKKKLISAATQEHCLQVNEEKSGYTE